MQCPRIVVWGFSMAPSMRFVMAAGPERCDPPDHLIREAIDAGCYFSLDSDAHAPGQLDFLQYGAARIEELGVPLERVITTWDVERVRAFARKEIA